MSDPEEPPLEDNWSDEQRELGEQMDYGIADLERLGDTDIPPATPEQPRVANPQLEARELELARDFRQWTDALQGGGGRGERPRWQPDSKRRWRGRKAEKDRWGRPLRKRADDPNASLQSLVDRFLHPEG